MTSITNIHQMTNTSLRGEQQNCLSFLSLSTEQRLIAAILCCFVFQSVCSADPRITEQIPQETKGKWTHNKIKQTNFLSVMQKMLHENVTTFSCCVINSINSTDIFKYKWSLVLRRPKSAK